MLFNSYEFILIMMPLSIMGYYLINRTGRYKFGLIYLIAISLVFVGYYNYLYVCLLVPNILFNYICSLCINRCHSKGRFALKSITLGVGVAVDVGVLLFFKYYNFFVENINSLFGRDVPLVNVILPLGISFYTFQQIAYLVDCYRDDNLRCDVLEYLVFMTFYPQFVQGPIVLLNEFLPQIRDTGRKRVNYAYLSRGIYRFTCGLAKKVLLADMLGLLVDGAYASTEELGTIAAICAIVAYALQIYFDFSGYSDMAVGLGLMFGIELPENFNSPYKAKTLSDFWDRWHITLTRFLTRYIYIPLGGNRKGRVRTYLNIFIVFLVSGLWHGASWTFILWGALHGIVMIFERILNGKEKIPQCISQFLTLIFVFVAWIPFRADSISTVSNLIIALKRRAVCGLPNTMKETFYGTVEASILCRLDWFGIEKLLPGAFAIVFIIVVLLICLLTENASNKMKVLSIKWISGFTVVVLFVWSLLSFSGISNFVYWNF